MLAYVKIVEYTKNSVYKPMFIAFDMMRFGARGIEKL
jgi:hypothetical protein